MTFTPRRLVDVASAVSFAIALALAVWPVSAPTLGDDAESAAAALAPSAPVRGGMSEPSLLDSTEAGIVRGNVFSSSRRAPKVRFVPPGSDGTPASMTAPDPYPMPAASIGGTGGSNAPSDSVTPANTDAAPVLYGIVSVDGTRRALLTLRAGEPPRLFAAGDRHAGFRVDAIEPDRVTLQSARGSRTLRMARPASRDSSEKTP